MPTRCNETLRILRASKAEHKNSARPSQDPPYSLVSMPSNAGIFRVEKK